jgi:hypothetical protein
VQKLQIDTLLNDLEHNLPAVAKILSKYGDRSVHNYVKTFPQNTATPIQSSDDLIQFACDYTRTLLGSETANALEKRLQQNPCILTANHHGVDYLSIFIQSNLIYGFDELIAALNSNSTEKHVIPIFACGGVSLDNPTYARGIILSRRKGSPDSLRKSPVKINIFSEKKRHSLVSSVSSFDSQMIKNSVQRVKKLGQQKVISDIETDTICNVLEEEYLSPKVLEQTSYSDQAVLLNQRLWKRMFTEDIREKTPELVFLEIEKIAAKLLEKDLVNPESFMHRIFFDETLRSEIFKNLNQEEGCWDLEKLETLSSPQIDKDERKKLRNKSGTIFFWGVDSKEKRVQLNLVREQDQLYLKGYSHVGEEILIAFQEVSLIDALQSGKIIPSLFTFFTIIAFARGMRCFGGFWQADYLPIMKKGIIKSLKTIPDYRQWAEKIESVPTRNYITGKTFIIAHYPNEQPQPAGVIEILTKGGLTLEDLKKLQELSVKEANLFGILDIYNNFLSSQDRDPHWIDSMHNIILDSLEEKLVHIRFNE